MAGLHEPALLLDMSVQQEIVLLLDVPGLNEPGMLQDVSGL